MLKHCLPSNAQKTVIDNIPAICYSLPNTGDEAEAASPALNSSPGLDFQGIQKSESKQLHSDSKLNPESLRVLSKADLITLLCRQPRTIDETDLHFVWKSAKSNLER